MRRRFLFVAGDSYSAAESPIREFPGRHGELVRLADLLIKSAVNLSEDGMYGTSSGNRWAGIRR